MESVELHPGVVSDSGILGGKPVIRGTRVPVALVIGKLAGGMTVEHVIEEYCLTAEDMSAALGYAAQRIEEESIYLTRR